MSQPIAGRGWLGLSEPLPGYDNLRFLRNAHVSPSLRRSLAAQVEWAEECIRLLLTESRRPCVAYSGGKDSGVLLHIARRVMPDVEAMIILDEEGPMRGVLEMVTWQRRRGVPVHEFVWGSIVESMRRLGRAKQDLNAVVRWIRQQGFDGCMRGIRAQESNARRCHAYEHHPVREFTEGYWEADPLIWWTVDEIWAYHALHGLPYCASYDAADDQPRHMHRIGSVIGTIGTQYGRLVRLKRYDPETYQRFVREIPEIRFDT